jgi:flagellar P-ring protein precursor FlgI
MSGKHLNIPGLMLVVVTMAVFVAPGMAATKLKNICRIKGQEENTLRGMGLVVGLNGTGEVNDPPTMRAISRSMEIMGNPLATNAQIGDLSELRKMKNAALVMVSAKVPSTGARRGDLLDCHVSAINGKSLDGGRLAFASLQGPNILDRRVYALCQGQVIIDNPEQPTVGVIHGGCQMEADVRTAFHLDGWITLVIDKNHANFQTVDGIKQEIVRKYQYSLTSVNSHGSSSRTSGGDASADEGDESEESYVKAIDAANIRVRIPELYKDDPVGFATELLDILVFDPEPEARVVINSRAGSIVISGDVEIGDVIISHKNVVIEAGAASNSFTAIDADKSGAPKLNELVNQLNALKVPTDDMIEIIRGIEQNGKLHGRLIVNE